MPADEVAARSIPPCRRRRAAEAGTRTILTTVSGFTSEGVPIADPGAGTIVRQTGRPIDPDVEVAAICAALTSV